jgi:hypothetical protein
MVSDATSFISNRKNVISITRHKIRHILSYVIECHWLLLNDNITYSLKEINSKTKIKPEEYFRTKFVDNYLRKEKHLLKQFNLEDIFFGKEEVEIYKNKSGIEQEDKIDIYVRDVALQKYWSTPDEVYFVIECKRIKILSDTKKYIEDIEKFCNRDYINIRLPFEGQIAFIENSGLIHSVIVDEINAQLIASPTITTNSNLSNIKLHSKLQCSYVSIHRRKFLKNDRFFIYHLMFDYSKIVLE